jgi:hypothetical protein
MSRQRNPVRGRIPNLTLSVHSGFLNELPDWSESVSGLPKTVYSNCFIRSFAGSRQRNPVRGRIPNLTSCVHSDFLNELPDWSESVSGLPKTVYSNRLIRIFQKRSFADVAPAKSSPWQDSAIKSIGLRRRLHLMKSAPIGDSAKLSAVSINLSESGFIEATLKFGLLGISVG